VTTLGLHTLRSKMCIIPQTPFIFSGTIRQNLDPFQKKLDAELWAALDVVGLRKLISTYPKGLETIPHFSAGQKQLFCLGEVFSIFFCYLY